MPDPRFDGSGVALITPFRDGYINERAFAEIVRFHHEEGTDALIVCGSTGEAAAMTADEQYQAVNAVVQSNAGKLPVIVGCGGTDTRQVMQLGAQARRANADAVLLSAPPYNKPPQRGLIEHFNAVLDTAGLPAIIYNVPGRTSVNILPDTIAELAEGGRVIGVKEACGDIVQIAELARLLAGSVAMYSGNDDQVVPILSLGGRGVITVLGNIAPAATSRMVHAYLEGKLEEATSLQLRYLPLIRALFAEPNPMPVKAAARSLGFDVGEMRLPLVEVDEQKQAVVLREMAALGIRAQTGVLT
jgi:4-hydroxy-tetrahydrodipicolinate synthase